MSGEEKRQSPAPGTPRGDEQALEAGRRNYTESGDQGER